jgi:hypothetical protein
MTRKEKVGTGLPVLPEGYFWRVGEIDDGRTSTDVVMLMKSTVEVSEVRAKTYWWKAPEMKTVTTNYDTRIASRDFYAFADTEEEVPEDAVDEPYPVHTGDNFVWRYQMPLTPENITKVAREIYDEFMKDREREERVRAEAEKQAKLREAYFGDYPSKVLVVSK